ncbi:glycosyltransferase involved in cell wall bisynthesis [Jatrophihabitans sp. GAS493]|uniref:glycosyltransferase family 4 protein n=1 Tax=Jatrophihabitans sp. GAS493 TaxID=1907575 RepID=UPI000BBFCBF8|nr:glycosyltransferase family 1 protein [Jatrophihabitans sp. GAS493]SOD73013.1 glycosyltransferase involved in cell wall bisynthesis [Jatrophihabitans sp. GAS493]
MRLAILLEQALSPVPGGTGRYSVELVKALVGTARADDSVSTWTAAHRDLTAAFVAGAAGPHRVALPRRGLIAAWSRGVGPRPRHADLVHAPTLLVPPRPRSGRLVVTIHDVVPWTHPQTLTPRGVAFHHAMAARAADYADAIAVPTQAVAAQLLEHVPGLTAERISVLGAGVSDSIRLDPTPERTADVIARLRLPQRYLLSLATLEPRKGLDVLLEALAATASPLPLLLVGQPGWGGLDVPAMAARLGLGPDRVRVLGRIEDADLAVVLRQATLLCAPSRAEGFGLPIAEAMVAATAVICSDDPAQVEVAGGAARVVAREDPAALATAIAELDGDDSHRSRLEALGRARSADFDWTAVGARAWELYRRL